nr:hypothetical protein [Tanacetum cinerariifolium]
MKCNGPLTPTVTILFEVIKTVANQYTGDLYKVKGSWMDQCVIDMGQRICSCRKWELTGLPCKHMLLQVSGIWHKMEWKLEFRRIGCIQHTG